MICRFRRLIPGLHGLVAAGLIAAAAINLAMALGNLARHVPSSGFQGASCADAMRGQP